jgi:hypothetical protein
LTLAAHDIENWRSIVDQRANAMYARAVYALGAAWAALFLASFLALAAEPAGDGFTRGLNRLASFMTWQGVAFGLAMLSALVTSRLAEGPRNFKLIGYGPLVVSGVLLAMLVALIAFRVLVLPAFS